MLALLRMASRALTRFTAWFDHRFAWFFTNGMKQERRTGADPLKA